MTEAEWEACDDLPTILAFVRLGSDRRRRCLFCAACCRRIWHLLKEQASRDAIEQLEQADFVFQPGSQQAAQHAAPETADDAEDLWPLEPESHGNWEREHDASTLAEAAATLAADLRVLEVSDRAASAEAIEVALAAASARGEITGNAVRLAAAATWKSIWEDASAALWNQRWRASSLGALRAAKRAVQAEQAGLLKDLFGSRFRPVHVERSWLSWNGGVVLSMARTIFEQRAFAMLPILADALEEAGCTDAHILDHRRQPGEHARGCWVLDALLSVT